MNYQSLGCNDVQTAHLEAISSEQDGADANAGVDGCLHGDHEVKHPPGSCKHTVRKTHHAHQTQITIQSAQAATHQVTDANLMVAIN